MPDTLVCPPRPPFTHVCGAGCATAPVPVPLPAVLPTRLTLHAPPTMRYAELVCTLTAAHARGVRQATVVIQRPSIPNSAR